MKELDLLKKDWQRNTNFTQVTDVEIYAMLHRKSSSIVKWIMIISILELLLWTIVGMLSNSDEFLQTIHRTNVTFIFRAINVIHYGVVVFLIYMFYKNYVRISTTASTKELMSSILKTRKTVQIYVWYNLAMMTVSLIIGFTVHLMYNPEVRQMFERVNASNQFMIGFVIGISLCIIVMVALFWLFYRLLYGILLRRLLVNYKELEKIDL